MKYIQSGGNWEEHIREGIRDASSKYRVKQKWYHVGALKGMAYAEEFQHILEFDVLIEAIADRCRRLGIYLREISSKDFDDLRKYTRIIFLKQDLKDESDYGSLLKNIRKGKLDKDFDKYYSYFKYTRHANRGQRGDIFRDSVKDKTKERYKVDYKEDDVIKEIEDELINNINYKIKRDKAKRRTIQPKPKRESVKPKKRHTKPRRHSHKPKYKKRHTKPKRHSRPRRHSQPKRRTIRHNPKHRRHSRDKRRTRRHSKPKKKKIRHDDEDLEDFFKQEKPKRRRSTDFFMKKVN